MNQKREPIVWMVQESWASNVDVSSALKYGKIEYILSVQDRPGQFPETCLRKIDDALNRYQEGDYFATTLADPAGPLLLGIAIALGWHGFDAIKWLRWERAAPDAGGHRSGGGFYLPTEVPCSGLVDLLEPVG